MSRTRRPEFVRVDLPELAGWRVAVERVRGLILERLTWDSSLENLLANAYLQGVMDVANSPHMIQRISEMQTAPDQPDGR